MTTVRIFFEKCGEAAYISLLDLQRVFHRILKMSDLPVYYTQGYNPHIYLSFSCPLSLGQESLCESCEVKTEQEMIDGEVWKNALQPLMPRGIVITKVAPAVEKVAEIETAVYAVTMPKSGLAAIEAYNNAEQAEVTKKTKRGQKELDLKTIIPQPYRLRGSRGQHRVLGQAALRQRRSTEPESLAADGLFTAARRRTHLAVPCPAHASL